jgi:hypothetical protein
MTITSIDLLGFSDEEFRAVVDADVRGKSEEDIQHALRSDPHLIRRWYDTLLSMKASVEGQLSAKAAEAKAEKLESLVADKRRDGLVAQASYERWRSGALRFRSGLESTILEARRHLDDHEAEVFRTAILAHRNHNCGPECDDTCIADARLWKLVSDD